MTDFLIQSRTFHLTYKASSSSQSQQVNLQGIIFFTVTTS